MTSIVEKIIAKELSAETIIKEERIQNLWSGYGRLNRIHLGGKSIILKLIQTHKTGLHPRGWKSDISHQRKEKSYQVETSWYQEYNSRLKDAYTPKLIASGECENHSYILLEDLARLDFYPSPKISQAKVKLCLKWLAKFHAHYFDSPANNLWEIGTYWHLNTRPDELEKLSDQELKIAAAKIDKKLNEATFQTLVHGDSKLANFLFNQEDCAAVDFQYVGKGVGVKDLAYFLGSVFEEEELIKNEKWCLDYYFDHLAKFMRDKIDSDKVEKEWRELYPFACVDFLRFIKGWSPGHWKINRYTENMKKRVLNCL